jgi:hypothetical protein
MMQGTATVWHCQPSFMSGLRCLVGNCKLERRVQDGRWKQRLLAHADGHGLGQFQSEVSSQLHGFLAYLTQQLG